MTGDARKLEISNSSVRKEANVPTPEPSPPARIYEFGPFQLDVGRYQLRREGVRMRMPPVPMELLTLFLERRGDLITREDIVARLWSAPEMVDVDQGINTAIRRIRQVLLDDPAEPRYIETVVSKGYRFIAEVKEVEVKATSPAVAEGIAPETILREKEGQGATPIEPVVSTPVSSRPRGLRRKFALIACSILIITAFAGYAIWRMFHRSPLRYTLNLSQVTTNDSEQRVTTAAISPDGKWIAYSDVHGLSLRLLQSGKTVALKAPASFRAERIAWFPDQTKLLVSGYDTKFKDQEIWTVFITGADAQLFRKNAHEGVPSPDGTKVAFTPGGDTEIWVSGMDGDDARPLVTAPSGNTFSLVFWAANGKRISYLLNQTGPGDRVYQSADVESGKVLTSQTLLAFSSVVALRDGRIFYTRDSPPGYFGDAHVLWVVDTDPATGAFTSQPLQLTALPKARVAGLTASDDGSRMSLVLAQGQSHIYVAKMEPGPTLGKIQRLTYDTRIDYPHSWLHDNETVIFESNRVGTYRLYGQRLGERHPQEFNTGITTAVLPQVTPDGKWILYAMNPDIIMSPNSRLFRIPVEGGTAEEVEIGGPLQEFECPLKSGSCVLMEIEEKKFLHYYALDPVTGKGRELGQTSWVPHYLDDWSISPDGTEVVLSVHDPANPRIRVVPLAGAMKQEREIKIHGFGMPSGINWAADGKGWFVSMDTGAGILILYVNQRGESRALINTPMSTWGVPSPDGTKLAFIDQAVDSNVWMWEIQARR